MSAAAPKLGARQARTGRIVGAVVIAALLLGPWAVAEGLMSAQVYDLFFTAAMVVTFWSLLPRTGLPRPLAAPVALLIGVLAIGAQAIWPEIRLAPYLAVAGINLGVSWIFWRGLRDGAEPILLQVIRMMRRGPETTPAFRHFVRGQCRLWCAMAAMTGFAGLAAMLISGSRPVLGPAILALLGGQMLWFVLSHHYAAWRYGRGETWGVTLRTLSRPATWAELKL
ncbi:MAG: hypothetical protein AAFR17_04165 [Pseudomonadota bacterium]